MAGIGECDHAIVVTSQEKLIAFFRFSVDENRKGRWLTAAGTWVTARSRRSGLAVSMWSRAIGKYKPSHVEVVTVSKSGTALVRKLEKLYPKICFDLTTNL